MAELIIRHPRTGHEVGIELRDFRHRKLIKDKDGHEVSYQDAGYRIVSNGDGSEYIAPEPRRSVSDPEQPAPKAED